MEEWDGRADAGDVEAAMRLVDCYYLLNRAGQRPLSDLHGWVARALELSGDDPNAVWRLAAVAHRNLYPGGPEHARWAMTLWARALRCESSAGVTIDPATFGPIFDAQLAHYQVANPQLALTSNNPASNREPLRRMAERFRYVRDDGVEFPVGEEVPEGPHWTASYVSDPLPGSPDRIVFDTQGVGYSRMLRTFLRIAIEEVVAAGLERPRLFSTPSTMPYLRATWEAEKLAFGPP